MPEIDFNSIDSLEVDDHLILLRQNAHRLQILNPLASAIWQLKKDGFSSLQIANEICQIFDIPIELALQDVTAINAQWALELTAPFVEKKEEKKNQPLTEELTSWQPKISLFFSLPQINVKVNFDSQTIAATVEKILSHLKIPGTAEVDIQLDVISYAGDYLIARDGLILKHTETENYTALMALHSIIDQACKHYDWLVVMHAAGVSWRGHGIVLPALGGSGKTTLIAALLKNGFDYINDDVIPLLRKSHDLISLPVSLSIKSGSWPILQSLYPEIEELEIFGNQDRSIKYLPPPVMDNRPNSYHAKHIILPDYRAGATPELKQLTKATALQAIIESESLLHLPLKKEDVTALIDWLSTLTCHRLTYDRLDSAVALITKFLEENYNI